MAYTTINKSSDYFNTKLYTGNGSTQSITGVGFQPDWTWIKYRNVVENHETYDAVRGVTKAIFTDSASAEVTQSVGLTSFDSDGFTLGNRTNLNDNSGTFVSWNWLAGTTSGLSGGTITPSAYSINATSGFGIYAYTGTNANGTITHGLGSAPSVIIVKNRFTSAKSWIVGHKSIGFQNALFLNLTDGSTSEPNLFNSTAPTSSVFTVGTGSLINDSGDSYIAYAFAEKKGFSKFGSYTGNGQSEDGPFIYTGFKPAFVIVKKYDSTGGNWVMWDNKRSDVPNANVNDQVLYPNASDAELSSATREIDTLSNGFKIRGEGGNINADADNFIYMAFAEAPLVGTNNIPCTAR